MNLRALKRRMIATLVPTALHEHGSVEAAAHACGVSTRTFQRWRREAEKDRVEALARDPVSRPGAN